MVKKPVSIVFAADLLAKHPDLVPEPHGVYPRGDTVIELEGNMGDPPLEALFDGPSKQEAVKSISLKECALYYPLSEINTLTAIRDDPTTSPVRAHRAAEALSRLAAMQQSDPASIYITDKDAEAGQILLTNLPERRIAAFKAGIAALPLHLPEQIDPHGIRYLLAPDELFIKIQLAGGFSAAEFFEIFPEEPPLFPNEYLVLYPASHQIEDHPRRLPPDDVITVQHSMGVTEYAQSIVRYHAGEKVFKKLQFLDPYDSSIPRNTPALAAYYDALRDPSIEVIVVSGPAGSGKTYSAFTTARESCISGQYLHTMVLKEGKSVIGAVKGGLEEKMAPMTAFGRDALRSAELKTSAMKKKAYEQAKFGPTEGRTDVHQQVEDTVALQWGRNFTSAPYEFCQGRTFDGCVVILDEAQRVDADMLDTLLTRPGHNAKLIVMGDFAQMGSGTSRARSGLTYASQLFAGAPNAARIQLSTVLRSDTAAIVVANRERVRREMGLPL